MSLLSLVLLSSVVGHPPSAVPRPEPIIVQGKVHAASGGAAGRARVLIITKNAEEYELHTPEVPAHNELERLAGVTVKIQGYQGDPRLPRGRHVMVNSYEILDVGNGVRPELGVIAEIQIEDKSRLIFVNEDGQAALLPEGWARKMQQLVGAKLWMVSKKKEGGIRPSRFAILRAGPTR